MANAPEITVGTITRTVLLFLALLNQALTIAGKSPIPINDDAVSQIIALAATIITSIIAWWKNNSFTKAARVGDKAKEEYIIEEGLAKVVEKMEEKN